MIPEQVEEIKEAFMANPRQDLLDSVDLDKLERSKTGKTMKSNPNNTYSQAELKKIVKDLGLKLSGKNKRDLVEALIKLKREQ